MKKLKELFKSGHLYVELATGISILVMAYVSSRVLPDPLSYLELSAVALLLLGDRHSNCHCADYNSEHDIVCKPLVYEDVHQPPLSRYSIVSPTHLIYIKHDFS